MSASPEFKMKRTNPDSCLVLDLSQIENSHASHRKSPHHRTISLHHHDKRTAGAASCFPSGDSNRVKGSQPLL